MSTYKSISLHTFRSHPITYSLRLLRSLSAAILYAAFLKFLASEGGMGMVRFFMATTGRIVHALTPESGAAVIGINFLIGCALLAIPLRGVKLIARNGIQKDPLLHGLAALFSRDPQPKLVCRVLLITGLVILPLKGAAVNVAQFIHGFNLLNSWEEVRFGLYIREYAGHAPLEIFGFTLVAMASMATCKVALQSLGKAYFSMEQCQSQIGGLSIWKQKSSTFLALAGLGLILISGIMELRYLAVS